MKKIILTLVLLFNVSHFVSGASINRYAYDSVGRLTGVANAKGEPVEAYRYDGVGNIVEKTLGGETYHLSYDAAHQLEAVEDAEGQRNFVYDDAGRLVAELFDGKEVVKYTYGYLDKVISVERDGAVTRFDYDAEGMLVGKQLPDGRYERWAWDGMALVARGGERYVNEAHITGGLPIVSQTSEGVQYHQHDNLGSTVASYAKDGAVVAVYEGTVYGKGDLEDSRSARFTGKPYDQDLGAYVFPFRNYSPDAVRWLSADPSGFPDGANNHYYACVPTMMVDPLGLATIQLLGNLSKGDTVTLGGGLGSLSIGEYKTKDYGTQSGAHFEVTPTITSPGSKVYRWRQYFSITDQDGNFLDWKGTSADNLLDPQPNDDKKDWYWTNTEWNTYKTADGVSAKFVDLPRLNNSRLTGGVTEVTMSFKLEFVEVNDLTVANGGTVISTLNWGFKFEN